MAFVSIEKDSIFQVEREPRPNSRPLYRAVICNDFWGVGDGVDFITGITLERITEEPEWDIIYDEIAEIGNEAPIYLPEGGLVVGQVYEAVVTPYRDWETGIVDDYDIHLVLVENYDE